MVNQQLLDYIKQEVQRGKNKKTIKRDLLGVGWRGGDIEEAFKAVEFTQLVDSSVPSSPTQEKTLSSSNLPGVGDLLKRVFSAYKSRLGTLVGIIFISLVAGLILYVAEALFSISSNIISGFGGILASILVSLIWNLTGLFIGFWAQIALIFAIKDREEKIGIVESFRRGWHKIISFAWVSFLVGFIVLGGYMLFMVPGIIFSIWFAFSTFVLISEDLRGMNAIFRSKQLVAGYWWKVLWRFFVMGVIVLAVLIIPFLIYMFLFAGSSVMSVSPAMLARFAILITAPLFIFLFINLFVTPFISVFNFLLYEDLKKQKAQVAFESPKKGTKIKYILIGIIGFLLIPAILVSIVLVSLSGARKRSQEVNIIVNMIQLGPAIETYYMNNNTYEGVNCSSVELAPLCSDIKKSLGETPTIESSEYDYCFYVKLPNGKYYCSGLSLGSETNIFPGGAGYCDGVTFNCP
jgi:hypothetical protein